MKLLHITTLLGIFIANTAMGTTLTQLTFGAGRCQFNPAFSPISNEIMYADDNPSYGLFTVSASGGSPTSLLSVPEELYEPAWFPDGQRVVFVNANHGYKLFRLNVDHSVSQVTFNGGRDDDPTVTPDGQWIVFVRGKFSGSNLWRVHPDGSGEEQLTFANGEDRHPSVTPNGQSIFFCSNRSGQSQIWRVTSDGASATQVTPNDGCFKCAPSVSPDGTRLAYSSDGDGFRATNSKGIFVCDINGQNAFNLTDGSLEAYTWPTWSHDGSMIAFQEGWSNTYPVYLLSNFDLPVATKSTSWGHLKSLYR